MPKIKILNPFAFKLGRKERQFYEIEDRPVYERGEYKTYRFDCMWYVTCRNNLIVTETTAPPINLIEHLVQGVEPDSVDTTRIYLQKNLNEQEREFNRVVSW